MTYGSNVAEQPPQIRHHAINVLPLVDKSMPLAVSDLPNDIECKELQPLGKVTDGIP